MPDRRARNLRARLACGGLALLVVSAPRASFAAEEGAGGFALAFGFAAGTAVASLPYILLRDSANPGPGTFGFALGAGRRADAFAMSFDDGGPFRRGEPLGFTARGRTDIDAKNRDSVGVAARFDALLTYSIAGRAGEPLVLDALFGGTVWPRLRNDPGETRVFAAVGPTLGTRLHVASREPSFYGEVELSYVPLFGRPPTERRHHVDLTTAVGYAPWPLASGAPAFELRVKRETGLGPSTTEPSSPTTAYAGTVVLVGVRLRIERM